MQFSRICLKDKPVFDKFLCLNNHRLSLYAFENIFIWKDLYDIFWAKIDQRLCVFFKDRVGCFLYLPPQGKSLGLKTVSKCFEIMDRYNKNRLISRIENTEKKDTSFYKKFGFEIILGGRDYICKRRELVSLSGNRLKRKRAAANFFQKNYCFKYRPYKDEDCQECLNLYKSWSGGRKEKNKDLVYQGLLDDNFTVFKTALGSYRKLGLIGKVIETEKRIQAATFGYALGNSFVVLFEICNLKFKGIAQYVFREFCREQSAVDINIMDDSGLESLKRVKLSYRPYRKVENFIVRNA